MLCLGVKTLSPLPRIVHSFVSPSTQLIGMWPQGWALCSNRVSICAYIRHFFRVCSRCQHWVVACRRTDLIDKAPAFLNHHYAICSDHFSLDQFTNSSRKVLKRKAVPNTFGWHGEEDSDFISPDVLSSESIQSQCFMLLMSLL